MQARSRIAHAVLSFVVFGLACGPGLGDPPSGSQQESYVACGTPDTITALGKPLGQLGGTTGTKTYSATTAVVVPPTIGITAGTWSGTPTASLTFYQASGPWITCTYSGGSSGTTTPLNFVSCADGKMIGAEYFVSYIQVSGHLPGGSSGSFSMSASLSKTTDDGNPCHVNQCLGGTVTYANAPDGTDCSADRCHRAACGAGTCGSAVAVNPDDGNSCTTDSCDPVKGVINTLQLGCGVPGGAAASYPGAGTVPTNLGAGMSFIYSGSAAVQTGLTATMVAGHVGVVRGRVLDTDDSSGLVGVKVSIVNHPEYGSTLTRTGGWYDIALNAGGPAVIQYDYVGTPMRFSAQRHVDTYWNDYTVAPDVILVSADAPRTVNVDSSTHCTPSTSWQAISGTTTPNDGDPARTARLVIPPSTCSSNWTLPAPTANFRLTEYTIGDCGVAAGGGVQLSGHACGPKAMPGDLPAMSGYTYAAELSIDGSPANTQINFTNGFGNNLFFYVDNFVGVPLDASTTQPGVPTGTYSFPNTAWSAEANGRVLALLSPVLVGGTNEVRFSFDGTNEVAPSDYTTMGITDGERAALVALYTTFPAQVWRVPRTHFSSFDLNWGGRIPPNAKAPIASVATPDAPVVKPECATGSIIECENQVLRESIPIADTPFTLNYRNEAQLGYSPTVRIPITDGTPVSSYNTYLHRIEARITIAGRSYIYVVPGTAVVPNQTITWLWDRTDAYGRMLSGTFQANVLLAYIYGTVPAGGLSESPAFGSYGGATIAADRVAREVWLYRNLAPISVGSFDAQPLGLGGWTLSAQHVLDTSSGTVWMGDGTKQAPVQGANIASTFYANTDSTTSFSDVGFASDGTAYATGASNQYWPSGQQLVQIANGTALVMSRTTPSGPTAPADGTAISNVTLSFPRAVKVDGNGNVYVADTDYGRIWKVTATPGQSATNWPVTLLAGLRDTSHYASGSGINDCVSGDGSVAANSTIGPPEALALVPDGSLLFSEACGNGGGARVRRIRTDGKLDTVAGSGLNGVPESACTATWPANISPTNSNQCRATLEPFGNDVYGLAITKDGSVLISDNQNNRIWQTTPDGYLSLVAGNGTTALNDGNQAQSSGLASPYGLTVTPQGIEIADWNHMRVRRIDSANIISTVAGGGVTIGSNAPATALQVYQPPGISVGPDGAHYFIDTASHTNPTYYSRILRFSPAGDTVSGTDIVRMSPNADLAFRFDSSSAQTTGRINASVTPLRGQTRYAFDYSSCTGGVLCKITDEAGNATTINYGAGQIVSPHGQVTSFALTSGYLTQVSDPNGHAWHLQYTAGPGLLTQLTDPNGNVHNFTYTSNGLLSVDKNGLPSSQGTQLARTYQAHGTTTTLTTPEYRVTSHQVDNTASSTDPTRTQERTHSTTIDPSTKVVHLTDFYSDGSEADTTPDPNSSTPVAKVTRSYSADPRFGYNGAFVSAMTVATGGLTYSASATRTFALQTGQTDPFALKTQTDALTINGVTYLRTFDTPNGTPKIVMQSPQGRQTVMTLDSLDRVIQVDFPGTTPVQLSSIYIVYDASGRVDHVTQGTRTTQSHYNLSTGFISSIDTPLQTGAIAYSYGSDLIGRPSSITLPGRSVSFGYDADDNVTSVTLPVTAHGSEAHSLTPNAVNLLATYDPPYAGFTPRDTTYAYDRDSLPLSVAPPSVSPATTYAYDSAKRVTSMSYYSPTGNVNESFAYDAQGRLSSISGDDVSLNYTWNGALKQEEKWTGTGAFTGAVDYYYDNFFRMKDRVVTVGGVAGKAIHLTYDNDGALSQVFVCSSASTCTTSTTTLTVNRTTGVGTNGLLTGTTLADGTHTISDTYQYDGYGGVTNYTSTTTSPTSTPYAVTYTTNVDPIGRITTKDESYLGAAHCTWSYVYGTTYQSFLTSATNNSSTACGTGSYGTIGFDADGNATTSPVLGTGNFDAQDRLTSYGSAYFYDNNGNLTSQAGGAYTYAYDALAHERQIQNGGNTYRFLYDAVGRRVGLKTNNVLTEGYVYSGDRIVATVTASGTLKAQFVYATKSNVPDLMIDAAGNVYRIISDQIGSVRARVSLSNPASVDEKLQYGPTGIPVAAPSAQPFGFAGGVFFSQAAQYHFGARDFNPWEARWWQKDPTRFGGGVNLYAYCSDDPINCIDPDGLAPWQVYSSPDEAARAAGSDLWSLTENNGTEYGTHLYQVPSMTNGGVGYAYGFIHQGAQRECASLDDEMNKFSDKMMAAAMWVGPVYDYGIIHSHPHAVTSKSFAFQPSDNDRSRPNTWYTPETQDYIVGNHVLYVYGRVPDDVLTW